METQRLTTNIHLYYFGLGIDAWILSYVGKLGRLRFRCRKALSDKVSSSDRLTC